jgi:predicted HTH transcriptional regulator
MAVVISDDKAMHRDYSNYSGYAAIAVLDDRIEIRSCGRLPTVVTVEQFSGRHGSKPPNQLITGAFHHTGVVEVWGRGTNRVIALCKQSGAAMPVFEDRHGFLIVTFQGADGSSGPVGRVTAKAAVSTKDDSPFHRSDHADREYTPKYA